MRANLLERQRVFADQPSLSEGQVRIDTLTENFRHEAANFENILAMTVGSGVFKLVRAGSLGLSAGYASRTLQAISYTGALFAEVSAFRGTHSLFERIHGNKTTEAVFERNGFLRTFTDFLALKVAGRMAQGQNIVFAHTLQSSAMVGSRYLNAGFGLLPNPQGSLIEQFAEAETLNLAMGTGQGLFGVLTAHRIQMAERALDIQTESSLAGRRANRAKAFSPHSLLQNILVMKAGEPPEQGSGNGGDDQAGEFLGALSRIAAQTTPHSPQEALQAIQHIVLEWFNAEMALAFQRMAEGHRPQQHLFRVLRDRRFLGLLPDEVRINLQTALDQIDGSSLSSLPPPIDTKDPSQFYFMSGSAEANVSMAGQLLKQYAKLLRQPASSWRVEPEELVRRLTGLAYYYKRLFESTQRERDLDFLTGLKNRRAFDRLTPKIEATLVHHDRSLEPPVGEYWVLALDGDRFKSVNDNYGHPNGDRALKHLARIFQESVRELNGDHVFRIGGEEFVILLKNPGIQGVWRVAKSIQQKLRENPVRMELSEDQRAAGLVEDLYLTVSIGAAPLRMAEIAEGQFSHEGSLKVAGDRADAALYEAKSAGRNQLMIAGKKEGQFLDEQTLEEMIARLP